MINITGILLNSIGSIEPDTTIRVTATKTGTKVKYASGSVITGSDGSYNFALTDGEYLVEIKYKETIEEYEPVGTVSITNGTGTIDLETLLLDYGV